MSLSWSVALIDPDQPIDGRLPSDLPRTRLQNHTMAANFDRTIA